uniref:Ribonuclease H-like domain-containing protein n=1 Tax=Tanacetum cinerariifolium TaxID=118510 RepID=A0A6L2K2F7_TANCI|nr:ribonuclease H-like domain-containing protein [Tanacetum cinerariifolium]
MAGSDNDSDDASVHNEATNTQQQPNIQPQIITTVSNNNAKFPYLKKDEYEVWAMKMEYWITNNDMNIWKVIQNGNILKRTGRDYDGESIPDDHVADFHYMDDTMDIWNAVKARFGGNAESKKMKKSMLKQEFLEFRTGDAGEFALMGVTFKTKLDNHLVQTKKWRNSSKNMFRLIDSSMSVRTKVGLGFTNCISENKLGWDDSAFSVFTTNSEDVEGRPIFHRFAKTDSMKVVPLPLSGDYTSLSDHSDLDESQMSYGLLVIRMVILIKRTGKVNIPPARPQPVPTGKPKVFVPVPTGRYNMPFPIPTDRGYSPSVSSGWWIDGQLLLSPLQVVLGNHIEKVYTGYPRTIVNLIHLHTDDNMADLLTKAFDGPRFNHLVVIMGMLNP